MIGFAPEEIQTGASTRSARLKWVVVVDESLPGGRGVNAAVCAAAATAVQVSGLLGPDAEDADGRRHPGLPWAGCSILAAPAQRLAAVRAAAAEAEGVLVCDMPSVAQQTRVYDEYLERMAGTGADDLRYCAVSIIGPRKAVDRIVGRLPLLP